MAASTSTFLPFAFSASIAAFPCASLTFWNASITSSWPMGQQVAPKVSITA